ncbi:alanine racemase [Aliiroseovarius crassostreae]|uniref:alanine racemase n=1 Tax=Aliiroseovarius crassostreae TaxID=154981 RepID=UPI0022069531|nr:alanine racemase [Aliiroseovarius crassostreae]UWQ09691.1 alanine racemase [Aliiroseovarius crassostreae]
MTNSPRIDVDLDKIRHNTHILVQRLRPLGISVIGVTKAVCGHPEIAKAMLYGGVSGLADARIGNAERMRRSGITSPIMMIRPPMLSQIGAVTDACNSSYNTEFETITALGAVAHRKRKVHSVILLIEMGDLRDGILPDDLNALVAQIIDLPGISLKGIATNYACLGQEEPNHRTMATFSSLADEVEGAHGPYMETVSGGSSVNLPWALGPFKRGRINELRLGEAILLGVNPLTGTPIPGLHTDAFSLKAEVIEAKVKTSSRGRPQVSPKILSLRLIPDHIEHTRVNLAIGYQDTDIAGLKFPEGIVLSGATSDHTVVETTDYGLRLGNEVSTQPNYSALMRAMAAPDVSKVMHTASGASPRGQKHHIQPKLSLVAIDGGYR